MTIITKAYIKFMPLLHVYSFLYGYASYILFEYMVRIMHDSLIFHSRISIRHEILVKSKKNKNYVLKKKEIF